MGSSDFAYDETNTWEVAMLDWIKNKDILDIGKMRLTSIDGFSERLRNMVNKHISRDILADFFHQSLNMRNLTS